MIKKHLLDLLDRLEHRVNRIFVWGALWVDKDETYLLLAQLRNVIKNAKKIT